jgi:hypothetical protein
MFPEHHYYLQCNHVTWNYGSCSPRSRSFHNFMPMPFLLTLCIEGEEECLRSLKSNNTLHTKHDPIDHSNRLQITAPATTVTSTLTIPATTLTTTVVSTVRRFLCSEALQPCLTSNRSRFRPAPRPRRQVDSFRRPCN